MKLLAVVTVALGLAFPGSVGLAQEPQGGEKKAGVEKEQSFAEKHELELKWANFRRRAGVWGTSSGRTPGRFSRRVRRVSARTWTNRSASVRRRKPRPPRGTAGRPDPEGA